MGTPPCQGGVGPKSRRSLREAGVAEQADAQTKIPVMANIKNRVRLRSLHSTSTLAQLDRVPDYESGG